MNRALVMSIVPLLLISIAPTASALGTDQLLQMVMTRDKTGVRGHPLFRVELRNTGDQPLILNLGTMEANGRKQHASAIHLLLKEPDGTVLRVEPIVAGVAQGRVDPLVVPLPAGATFTLRVDLADYGAPNRNLWTLNLTAGSYSIQAEYEGKKVSMKEANADLQGLTLMPYWIGTIQSSVLDFVIPVPVKARGK